jgi:dehydrodolichyl diphosphate syntase complex subunit NUS1
MQQLQDLVIQKLTSYYGAEPGRPSLTIYAPNLQAVTSKPEPSSVPGAATGQQRRAVHLDLLLLSATDGRDTLVDLTRTLTEMAQSKKIHPRDITSDLIDAEILATTAIPGSEANGVSNSNGHGNDDKATENEMPSGEPDLLIVFGPYVKLDGYPPWQIRLTEIFCVGGDVKNASTRVEYQGFLRGLWRYAGAEMRFGR